MLEDAKIFPLTSLRSEEGVLVIYKYVYHDCLIIQGKLGAPASAGFLEELIVLRVNKVMFCGGGGVLKKNISLGKFIVVDSAVRDEGLSYHYLKPSREIKANEKVVKTITNYLDGKNIDYVKGKTWTTDAFYRETKGKIKLRKEEGCVIVEME